MDSCADANGIGASCHIVKHLSNPDAKHLGDAESGFQRGGIFILLDGVDRLAGDADLFGQLALGHFALLEAEPADVIADGAHSHTPRR